jgi:hypothetical protein
MMNNTLPEKRPRVNGIEIEKVNPVTQDIVETFASVSDVIKQYPMSRQTLQNAITHKYQLRGFLWREK